MGSKAFIFIGLLLAFVLLISSEVAARDLVEISAHLKNDKVAAKTNGVGETDVGVSACSYGCCSYSYGRCVRCCTYTGEAKKWLSIFLKK